jgi:thiosulfate/3-mercaptopyruvate sulfurtransferase
MNIISADQLEKYVGNRDTIIVDARGGADARERYKAGHLKNALFADLETDLSEKKADAADGGRHPLPDPQNFSLFLGRLGITPDSVVIVYDDKSGANAAARFWWMLKAAGHSKVYVVSGGLDSIRKAGLPVVTDLSAKSTGNAAYPFTAWNLPLFDINDVASAVSDSGKLVIDVRENYRFVGESEPIDLVAGHIPGAMNIPYTGNLDESGEFLSTDELAAKYGLLLGERHPESVIVHCGSGVTACHTLLALAEAGFEGAGLYVGSWSEWSRNERPVATGQP